VLIVPHPENTADAHNDAYNTHPYLVQPHDKTIVENTPPIKKKIFF
jgi:hypothetical protein